MSETREPSLDHPAAAWPEEVPTERTVELAFGEYVDHSPMGNPAKRWEHLEFDNTRCGRGHLCVGYERSTGETTVIGGYLSEDHNGYPRSEWNAPWYFPSAPGMVMCGECAELVDDVDYEEAVFTGNIADASWFIDRAPAYCADTGKFYAWVGYFAPDGGLNHEIELGTFATVGAARTAIAIWGGERNRELDRAEAEIDRLLGDEPMS